ncbi:hypothetical protein IMSHALPRED_002338 [Imshaugia aleurites]|uniref:Heterokaryon incompatibility domain-containing protein n=1 Tax=Imshaugia aleurites TaxID=172621 RepID=A0A8H3F0R4_9LECA|nr:hypothetical protein IMSHALPRED_002338 [Imshaugia aleurites]
MVKSKQQIEIQLEEYSLQQAPPYKALSYTWGAHEKPKQIIIGEDSYLDVTKTLLAFLITTWNVVKIDKDRRLAKLALWPMEMFHHEWFMRLWVLQEVVYAQYITILFQLHDKRKSYRPWAEALEFGTKFCGARDPKDKVSALLALASDVDLDTFHIDYRMS